MLSNFGLYPGHFEYYETLSHVQMLWRMLILFWQPLNLIGFSPQVPTFCGLRLQCQFPCERLYIARQISLAVVFSLVPFSKSLTYFSGLDSCKYSWEVSPAVCKYLYSLLFLLCPWHFLVPKTSLFSPLTRK